VELRFASPVDAAAFERAAGLSDVEIQAEMLRCRVHGPMDALVRSATRFVVIDVQTPTS
jgi:hypothetical protein